ncbi:MAG: transporter substrate-binding domain-containing protein [Rhodospirillales bacterium]|nr:transporter substrate-binding domain-containing protein [Rhodospirillales bacterium]
MKIKLLLVLGTFAVLTGIAPAYAAEKLVFNTGIRDPFTSNDKDGFIDLIIKETFHRIGLDAEVIVYQNSAKSLKNANDGIDDGAALRIEGLEKKFPNLIRVPEKLMDNDFVAYTIGEPQATDSWASMDEFKIAYINGWQIFQNNLANHKATTKTKTAHRMLDLLTTGKVDLILYERWQGLWLAQQFGITIQVSEPPLAKMEMFMYLNKKHAGLIEKAAAALSEMKKDGTYKNIFDKTLGRLLK